MKEKKSTLSRREFMNCLGISFVSLSGFVKSKSSLLDYQEKDIFPPRSSGLSHTLTQNKSAVVVVEGKNIHKMISKGLGALKLPEDFFKDKKIVIKPNTHWSEDYPSTTDPLSLLPVIDFLRERKSGNITVADGSGKDLPNYRAAFEFIGFDKVLIKKGVNIIPLDIRKPDDFIAIKSPAWSVLKTLNVHRLIYHAPVLISMTCLKRHGSPRLTAALKNNIGAICVHSRNFVHYETGGKVRETIAEIAHAVRPDITIIDARDILVKRGPMFMPDKSNLKRGINKVLISSDTAALDTVASQLMSEHDETFPLNEFQPTLDHAYRLKLGNIKSDFIDLINLRV